MHLGRSNVNFPTGTQWRNVIVHSDQGDLLTYITGQDNSLPFVVIQTTFKSVDISVYNAEDAVRARDTSIKALDMKLISTVVIRISISLVFLWYQLNVQTVNWIKLVTLLNIFIT
jgi:hypothetical protein